MGPSEDQKPLIQHNPSLQRYYASPESRIGYWALLGRTRHFGYYDVDTYWPFPINKALRAMEEHLFHSLSLPPGSEVLDAGCGVGHVAAYLGFRGLRVQGIDVVDHHIEKAQRMVRAKGLEKAITVRKLDYQYLDPFADESFDGVFTMETFVHATEPERALAEFFRVLKPGGRIALYEYDHHMPNDLPEHLRTSWERINEYAAMPTNARFAQGVLPRMLEDAGFQDVEVEDLSRNIRPMLRLFFVIAYIPYLLIILLGLQAYFVNTMAGVEGYRGRHLWRYVAVTAKKPTDSNDHVSSGVRERKTGR